MAQKSDQSLGSREIQEAQKLRLRWLRGLLTPVQADAAKIAGVSPYSWNRMEAAGGTRIDIVALARFCQHHKVPAEYVVSGDLSGLRRALQLELLRIEQSVAAADERISSRGS